MDAWQGITSDPITLHKYLYANADPASFTDPSGRFSVMQFMVATGVAGSLSSFATSPYSPFNSSSDAPGLPVPTLEFTPNQQQAIGDVITHCIAEQYGDSLAVVRGVIETANFPIYKPLLGVPTLKGASKVTNFISAFGLFKYQGLKMPFRLLGSNRVFGVAGRVSAVAGSGFAAYDITGISLCINHHL